MQDLSKEQLELIYEMVDCEYEDDEEKEYDCNNCKHKKECFDYADWQLECQDFYPDFTGCGYTMDDFWNEID